MRKLGMSVSNARDYKMFGTASNVKSGNQLYANRIRIVRPTEESNPKDKYSVQPNATNLHRRVRVGKYAGLLNITALRNKPVIETPVIKVERNERVKRAKADYSFGNLVKEGKQAWLNRNAVGV